MYSDHPLVRAVRPLADAIGATIVAPSHVASLDVELEWDDEVVAGLRLAGLNGALDRLIVSLERELGGPLGDLPRQAKQAAVRLLHERGAFLLRGAAEDISHLLRVSRFTVYSYLNAIADCQKDEE